MKSKVYFISVNNSDSVGVIKSKLAQLIEKSKVLDFIRKDDQVVIKMHFGEKGNTGYVKPDYIRVVSDNIIKKQTNHFLWYRKVYNTFLILKDRLSHPLRKGLTTENRKRLSPKAIFLSDTNTLYPGRRRNLQDHLKLAYEHGFTKEACGCSVLIADDTKKENVSEVLIKQKFIKTAKIAKLFLKADVILGIAHFKGHLMTGFGGALKNIGMGCATREGKLAQHSDISPFVRIEKCIACKECLKTCPADAVFIKNNKAYIDPAKCIGCASCIAACVQNAIDVDWEAGGSNIQEKMVEYAKAVLEDKQSNSVFINFATKITQECDCLAKDDPRIVPDVGILASQDPVSIDKASFDLINKAAGRDLFKEVHPLRDGLKQLRYAYKIGLGKLEYELIEISDTTNLA